MAKLTELIAETDALTSEFGDAELRRRNAAFDRQFATSERKTAQRVALAIALVTFGAVVLMLFGSGHLTVGGLVSFIHTLAEPANGK